MHPHNDDAPSNGRGIKLNTVSPMEEVRTLSVEIKQQIAGGKLETRLPCSLFASQILLTQLHAKGWHGFFYDEANGEIVYLDLDFPKRQTPSN